MVRNGIGKNPFQCGWMRKIDDNICLPVELAGLLYTGNAVSSILPVNARNNLTVLTVGNAGGDHTPHLSAAAA